LIWHRISNFNNIMKKLILVLLLLPVLATAQKKQQWPDVPFNSVRVYMYNIHGNLWGNHSIIKNGNLDTTVWDAGVALNRTQELRLLDLFNQDIALLQEGLGKCYIPHHGFVFYDANKKPVAWASVCFMCDGAKVYFPEKIDKPAKYNSVNEKKVLEQMKELRSIVSETGLPVFGAPELYLEYFQKLEKEKNKSKMELVNEKLLDEFFPKDVSPENIQKYIINDTAKVEIKPDHKIAAGGRQYYFFKGKYKSSAFHFSGSTAGNTVLDNALVKDFNVNLIEKINIGMSFDDLPGLFVYDGISNPEELIITNEKKSKKLILRFINGNLQEYELIDEGF